MSLTISPEQIVANSTSPLLAAPEDWPRRPLGEIVSLQNGYAFKSKQFVNSGGTPLIRIRDLYETTTAVSYAGDYDSRYIVRPGALLVGMDGDFNVARWQGPEALLNQRVCRIDPDHAVVDVDFLARILPGYLHAIHDVTSSTTVTHLSSRDIGRIPVPVPPLAVQRALMAVLTAVDGKASTARSHLVAASRDVGRFRNAVIGAACTGRLTSEWRAQRAVTSAEETLSQLRHEQREREGKRYREPRLPDASILPDIPEKWTWATLPELGEMGRGKSKHRPRNDPALYGGEYPFVQTGDVARSDGRIIAHSQTYNQLGLAQSRLWPEGTVCITIAANIANSALLSYPACFPDSVVGLIVDKDIAVAEYIELFMRTARRNLAAFAPATAQANINLAVLSELAVALPPLEEQYEIVRLTSELFEGAAKVAASLSTAEKRIDRTRESALAKALRGQLVGN